MRWSSVDSVRIFERRRIEVRNFLSLYRHWLILSLDGPFYKSFPYDDAIFMRFNPSLVEFFFSCDGIFISFYSSPTEFLQVFVLVATEIFIFFHKFLSQSQNIWHVRPISRKIIYNFFFTHQTFHKLLFRACRDSSGTHSFIPMVSLIVRINLPTLKHFFFLLLVFLMFRWSLVSITDDYSWTWDLFIR